MDWRLPFIIFLFLFLFIFFLLKQLHLPHLAAKRSKPPLPPVASPLPFLSLLCNHGFSLSKLELLLRRFHSFLGPILTLRLLAFAPPVIFISGASAAHDALIQQGDDFAGRPPAVEPFIFLTAGGRDISFSDYGPLWRLLRGNLFRVLHPSRFHLFAPARRCALLLLLKKLQSQSPDGSGIILPKESFRRALFNLHISMCFGEKLKEREIREIESLQLFLLSLFTTFNVFAVLPAVAKLLYHKRWKKIVDARKRQAAIFLSLIKRRRKHEDYHSKGVNYCYVDSLLDLRLPEEEGRWLLIDEAVNLCHEFLSGVETTTTVLEWTMAELAKHQEVQRKLVKEIKSIVAGDEDLLEEEQLKKMSYLKAVVLEALRRHPPSHFLLQHSVRDDVVLNGYLIPRGTEVRFSVANMNWDEEIWDPSKTINPNPLQYRRCSALPSPSYSLADKQRSSKTSSSHILPQCFTDLSSLSKSLSLSLSRSPILSLPLFPLSFCYRYTPQYSMDCWKEIDGAKLERCVWVPGPIIVGGGPSGLAAAACLKAKGVPSLVLERAHCIASLWQLKSYDRLRLHLPKSFCELPLKPFPASFPAYPTKQQFVAYLEAYATEFGIRPAFGEAVVAAEYDGGFGFWRVRTEKQGKRREYVCRWLVVATGENAEEVVPEIAGMSDFRGGAIVHTSRYRSGEAFMGKSVLVVGCGNSGMEVCLDLSNHGARPAIVVRDTVHVLPREMLGRSTFGLSMWLLRWLPVQMVDRLLLFVAGIMLGDTGPLGLRRPKLGPLELKSISGKTPVLDVGTLSKIKSGDIKVFPAIKCFTAKGVEFVDGRSLEFDAVVLATGYRSNVPSWLKERDFFSEQDGLPRRPFPNGWKGERGLYAVGFTKRGLLGASMDAMKVAQDIEGRWLQ